MYPMYTWGYESLLERLNHLLASDVLFEAVFATCATHEQCFKRLIRGELTRQRKTIKRDANRKLVLSEASSAQDLDGGMFLLQGLDNMKGGWKLTFARHRITTLPVAVNRSKGTWQTVPALFRLRNRLAHGTASPPSKELEQQARAGITNLTNILDPDRGLASVGVGSPFERLPNIRHIQ